MADFKDYIISQQDFSGLEKLAEREEAKAASRAKAEEERKARKAATTQYLTNYLKSDDYLTGTVHDPHITEKVSELLNSGIELADKGANASEIVVALSPQATKLGRESQALKELERRRKEEEAVVKSIPGADVNLFNQGWREGIYLNPDGSLREVSSIDLSKDYGSMIRDNYPMWNNSAVDSFVSKAKPITYNKSVSVQDAKKAKRDTEIEVSSPLHMQPVIKNGIFEGDFEAPYDLYTENGQVKQMPVYENGKQKVDNQGNPVTEDIKLLKKEDWSALKNDYPTYQLIRQKTRQAGVDPDTPDGDRIANAIGYDLINTTTKAKVSFSEKSKSQAAPVIKSTTNVNVGGAGAETRDIHTPAVDIYNQLQTKKDKVAELIKQGKSDDEIKKDTGLEISSIKASRQGRNKAALPLNTEGLDAEFVNSIVDLVNKGGGYTKEEQGENKKYNYDAKTLYVVLGNDNKWKVYSQIDYGDGKGIKNELRTTINPTTLGYRIQPSSKGKGTLSAEEKKQTNKSKTFKGSNQKMY